MQAVIPLAVVVLAAAALGTRSTTWQHAVIVATTPRRGLTRINTSCVKSGVRVDFSKSDACESAIRAPFASICSVDDVLASYGRRVLFSGSRCIAQTSSGESKVALIAALLFSSELAYSTQGCGTLRFRQQLAEAEASIVHAVKFSPPVGEMPTRSGSYECVRFSFLVDRAGHPTDIRYEESSGDFSLIFSARQALDQFRFRHPRDGARLMLVFDGMVGRWPEPPSDQC